MVVGMFGFFIDGNFVIVILVMIVLVEWFNVVMMELFNVVIGVGLLFVKN